MNRETALVLQNTGMLLIIVVMLTDSFLYALTREFIIVCALISAVLMIIGISILKKEIHL